MFLEELQKIKEENIFKDLKHQPKNIKLKQELNDISEQITKLQNKKHIIIQKDLDDAQKIFENIKEKYFNEKSFEEQALDNLHKLQSKQASITIYRKEDKKYLLMLLEETESALLFKKYKQARTLFSSYQKIVPYTKYNELTKKISSLLQLLNDNIETLLNELEEYWMTQVNAHPYAEIDIALYNQGKNDIKQIQASSQFIKELIDDCVNNEATYKKLHIIKTIAEQTNPFRGEKDTINVTFRHRKQGFIEYVEDILKILE